MVGGVVLIWDTTSANTGYRVYRATDDKPFEWIASTMHRTCTDWHVTFDHRYHYYVTAFNMHGESGPSNTVAFPDDHRHPGPGQGVVTGRVTDDGSGMPLRDAIIQFYRHDGFWIERTHTDTGGVYWAALDTGNYIMRADAFGYVGEFYDNALRIADAAVVPLAEDTVNADFALHKIPPPVPVTVTGRVTDSVSGAGIPNAFVALLRPLRFLRALEMATDLFGGFPGERCLVPELGELRGAVWVGKTDSTGNYAAHVIGGGPPPYIALAFKPGYAGQFFNDKYSPLDADRLTLLHDTSGIDFALRPNPPAANSLSGTVSDTGGMGVPSAVVLYRKALFGHLFPVRFAMTDSTGAFTFPHLYPGNVYLKAIPVSDFAPAWYSAAECGVARWRHADSVVVNGDVAGVNICVVSCPPRGLASISGGVSMLLTPGAKLAALPPGQGVSVYAISNATNAVAGFDITEEDGTFSIDNLAAGSYTLATDKEGFEPASPASATVDGSNGYQSGGNSLQILSSGVTGTGPDFVRPAQYRLNQNYPNPFNPSTKVSFDLPASSIVTLRVFNLLGQEVAELMNTTVAAGTHSVQWNGLDLNGSPAGSGIYFMQITATPADGKGEKFSAMRKMMLLR